MIFDPVTAAEVCLVPNIVIPKKFRVLEFVKYTGMECPKTHLSSYYNKMAEVQSARVYVGVVWTFEKIN
jgi:hypothetical protein